MSKAKDRTPGKVSGHIDRQLAVGATGASELSKLTDVSLTTPATGQALTYDSLTNKWSNSPTNLAAWFDYHSNATFHDIAVPPGATNVIEAEVDAYLTGGNAGTFPSIELLGFQPFQVEEGVWQADTHYASQTSQDSAPTSYFNQHNVTARTIKLGYHNGGTGHSLNALAMHVIKVRVKKVHINKVLFTAETFGSRTADGYPVFFRCKAIIGQPFSDLTALRFSIANYAFTFDSEARAQ